MSEPNPGLCKPPIIHGFKIKGEYAFVVTQDDKLRMSKPWEEGGRTCGGHHDLAGANRESARRVKAAGNVHFHKKKRPNHQTGQQLWPLQARATRTNSKT